MPIAKYETCQSGYSAFFIYISGYLCEIPAFQITVVRLASHHPPFQAMIAVGQCAIITRAYQRSFRHLDPSGEMSCFISKM
jgi:hypothetical protein